MINGGKFHRLYVFLCHSYSCWFSKVHSCCWKSSIVWMVAKILHQLRTVVYPIIFRLSTIRLVVRDFFHSQYLYMYPNIQPSPSNSFHLPFQKSSPTFFHRCATTFDRHLHRWNPCGIVQGTRKLEPKLTEITQNILCLYIYWPVQMASNRSKIHNQKIGSQSTQTSSNICNSSKKKKRNLATREAFKSSSTRCQHIFRRERQNWHPNGGIYRVFTMGAILSSWQMWQ